VSNDTSDTEESVEDEVAEDKPAPKAKAPVEEEDEPVAKKASSGECPNGFKFGKDWGEEEKCDLCPTDTYRACRKASRE
jgi:hypothetical protein